MNFPNQPGSSTGLRLTGLDGRRCLLAVLIVWFLALDPLAAHDSPEHVIEALTTQMKRQGKSPELLYQRATEYHALGKYARATADLRDALERHPGFVVARAELSRIYLLQGKTAKALEAIETALNQVSDPAGRAPLLMLRAEVHAALKRWDLAVADADQALHTDSVSGQVDWYLLRAQFQSRLGRFDEAAAGLRDGHAQTGSYVLFVEQIEASIDAGHYDKALRQIDPELEASRWTASWRIRRARALLGLGDRAQAELELRAALDEIALRLNPIQPDLALWTERGRAKALLGDRKGAMRDLAALKKKGASPWLLWRLERELE